LSNNYYDHNASLILISFHVRSRDFAKGRRQQKGSVVGNQPHTVGSEGEAPKARETC